MLNFCIDLTFMKFLIFSVLGVILAVHSADASWSDFFGKHAAAQPRPVPTSRQSSLSVFPKMSAMSVPPPSPNCDAWGIVPRVPCDATGRCPAFDTLLEDTVIAIIDLLHFDATAPDSIYTTWPAWYLQCLFTYCDATTGANAGNAVCWPLAAARATRDAKQILQAKQAYLNVLCPTVTDCAPWQILLAPNGVDPNPDPFGSQPTVAGLPVPWHPSVTTRINPLGVFPGAGNLHYYYGLGQPARPQDVVATSSRINQIVFTQPFSAKNNVVCGQVDIGSVPFTTNILSANFTHYFCFAFTDGYQIIGAEINFRHLGTESDLPLATPSIYIAAALCPKIQADCTGANQQYASVAACEAYVGGLPVVSWDKGNQANVPCIELHQILIEVFPDIHCPHVGPTGGGMCTNVHNYLWDYVAVPTSYMSLASPNY